MKLFVKWLRLDMVVVPYPMSRASPASAGVDSPSGGKEQGYRGITKERKRTEKGSRSIHATQTRHR